MSQQNAVEIQSAADRKNMIKFHDALKTVYGPNSSRTTQLLITDGSALNKEVTDLRIKCLFEEILASDYSKLAVVYRISRAWYALK